MSEDEVIQARRDHVMLKYADILPLRDSFPLANEPETIKDFGVVIVDFRLEKKRKKLDER
jgi:hypothetical protein